MKIKYFLPLFLMILLLPCSQLAAHITVTVADGTNNNQFIPIEGYNADSGDGQQNQMLYPAEMLTELQGQTLGSMKFYIDLSANNGSYTNADRLGIWTVSIGETDNTIVNGLDETTVLTPVYTGYLNCATGVLTIEFSTPYRYHGHNLLIQFKKAAGSNSGQWNRWYFLGTTTQNNASYNSHSSNNYSFLPKVTFRTPVTCFEPQNLHAVLTQGDGSVATLQWKRHNNGNEDAWRLQYGTDPDFAEGSYTEMTEGFIEMTTDGATFIAANLTDLTPDQTLYARVKADCGNGNESDWSNVSDPFTPTDVYQLTLNDGTTTNYYIPIYYYVGYFSNIASQFILPSTSTGMDNVQWGRIEKLTFYNKSASVNYGNAVFEVYVGETDATTQTDFTDWGTMQKVYTGTVGVADHKMVIDFDTPYRYSNGNLLIGFKLITLGTSATYNDAWYGVSATTGASAYTYTSTTVTRASFLPKVTIDYEPGAVPSCIWPSALEVTSAGQSATLTWEGYAQSYDVACTTNDEANPDESIIATGVAATTYTVESLPIDNDYYFRVRSNCDNNDQSEWSRPVGLHIGYCIPAPVSVDQQGVTNVTFGNSMLVNDNLTMTAAPYYYNHTHLCGSAYPSGTVDMRINYATSYNYYTWVWVDWNNDMVFSDDEQVYTPASPISIGILDLQFNVPSDTPLGNYRMRIQGADNNTHKDPCYTGNYSYLIDYTLNIMEEPSHDCPPPSDFALANVTSNAATFSWTQEGDIQEWTIAYKKSSEDVYTFIANVTQNPYTLGGNDSEYELEDNTEYDVEIFAGCDTEMVYPLHGSFLTECKIITVDDSNPFIEDFEGTLFAPSCWALGEPAIYTSGNFNWKSSTNYHHSGSNSAYNADRGTIYLYTPILNITSEASIAELSFWSYDYYITYYTGGTSGDSDGLNIVKITTDGGNTWTQLWCPTIDELSANWKKISLDLTDYIGQDIQICFEYQGNNANSWYIDDVRIGVGRTFTKQIAGYGDSTGGYVLIASPLADEVNPEDINELIADPQGDFDLYEFDQAQDNEWRNYKANHFNFVSGKGYLTAFKQDATITFTGVPYTGDGTFSLVYTTAAQQFPGWNLIGNPYPNDATVNITDFFRMNPETGNELILGSGVVHLMEGIFVKANDYGEQITFTELNNESDRQAQPDNDAPILDLTVTHEGQNIDLARVRFGEGSSLEKFQMNQDHTKLYIQKEGKDYAVVVNAAQQGELPVCFKAEENGTYTLNCMSQAVNLSYLHLIDNITGIDQDLLADPSYSFEAYTTDYASRFRLVFATGSSVDGNNFGFVNGMGKLIIYGIEGEATLQVVDGMGRVLSSEQFNGSYERKLNVAPGLYLLRLINENQIKVQKIVVK